MKRTNIFICFIGALVFILASAGWTLAEMHQKGGSEGMPQGSEVKQKAAPEEEGGWFCPWCGSSAGDTGRMGRGMKQGRGMMHEGRGMMHQGRGMHHGWSRGQCPRSKTKEMAPMGQDEARTLMKNYVSANPNLKIGEIEEKDEVYVGEIVTKDGSLVEKLVVDKKTGWMKREY